MKLIPNEIEATLPSLYSQENVPDPVAVVKFFDPCPDSPSTLPPSRVNPVAPAERAGRGTFMAAPTYHPHQEAD